MTNAPRTVHGNEGVFPYVEVSALHDRSAPLFGIWGATVNLGDPPRLTTLSTKYRDVVDDEHDPSFAIALELSGFTLKFTHSLGIFGEAFLVRGRWYDGDLTLEQWADKKGQRNGLEQCDPETCPYHRTDAHRAWAPYQPPFRKLPSAFDEPGGILVNVDMRWSRDDDD